MLRMKKDFKIRIGNKWSSEVRAFPLTYPSIDAPVLKKRDYTTPKIDGVRYTTFDVYEDRNIVIEIGCESSDLKNVKTWLYDNRTELEFSNDSEWIWKTKHVSIDSIEKVNSHQEHLSVTFVCEPLKYAKTVNVISESDYDTENVGQFYPNSSAKNKGAYIVQNPTGYEPFIEYEIRAESSEYPNLWISALRSPKSVVTKTGTRQFKFTASKKSKFATYLFYKGLTVQNGEAVYPSATALKFIMDGYVLKSPSLYEYIDFYDLIDNVSEGKADVEVSNTYPTGYEGKILMPNVYDRKFRSVVDAVDRFIINGRNTTKLVDVVNPVTMSSDMNSNGRYDCLTVGDGICTFVVSDINAISIKIRWRTL